MLLEGKNAVIYGAGGSLGAGVAQTFAREGAMVFLTGRTRAKLDEVAKVITEAGGSAEVAVVDALDEHAVDEHARLVVAEAGGIDVSLNLVSRGDVQGVPLVEMETADLIRAIMTGITTNFITARAAARHMTKQGSGVILALDSGSAHGSPMMGSTGLADAATDILVRNLAAEIGPRGVRVVGMWIAGVPETLTPEKLAAVNSDLQLDDTALQGLLASSPPCGCSAARRAWPTSPTPRRSWRRTGRPASPAPSSTSPAGSSRADDHLRDALPYDSAGGGGDADSARYSCDPAARRGLRRGDAGRVGDGYRGRRPRLRNRRPHWRSGWSASATSRPRSAWPLNSGRSATTPLANAS
ncbi:MAG: SDR family NAD(P)-dependent oxidoreductase [Pseudonocardia sp.]